MWYLILVPVSISISGVVVSRILTLRRSSTNAGDIECYSSGQSQNSFSNYARRTDRLSSLELDASISVNFEDSNLRLSDGLGYTRSMGRSGVRKRCRSLCSVPDLDYEWRSASFTRKISVSVPGFRSIIVWFPSIFRFLRPVIRPPAIQRAS
jgi:hypothetical protein